jgi:methionyl-tRNA formyltransferase
MGTPDFAVPSLQAIHEAGFSIVAVITAPDKPAGRGMQMQMSPVKRYALSHSLPVLQPEKLKDPSFVSHLQSLKPDLGIVVAFRMLPEVIWKMPILGTFNLHASLLPRFRGAAPINWALILGEKETGVTTFFLQHAIDTGDLLLQEKESILPEDTFGTLYNRLMHKGAGLVLQTALLAQNGSLTTRPQEVTDNLPIAPKLSRETGLLKWPDMNSQQVHGLVRGLSPVPGAYTYYRDKLFKILFGKPADQLDKPTEPGEWFILNRKQLFIGAKDRWYEVLEIQPEGKKAMTTEEFLRGFKQS